MRPIIVVGPERSGTSACTEMIHEWGAYGGEPHELSAADEHNPHGYFEYKPLWTFLDALGEFGSGKSWWDEDFGDRVAAKAQDPRVADEARELMARMGAAGRPWVWKDPALCHFLSFWRQFWHEPVYVVTVRHPVDIAVSWQKLCAASGSPVRAIDVNLLRWQHMSVEVLRHIDAVDAKQFVEYEALVADPLSVAERLATFLDAHVGTTTARATIDRMAAAIDPALNRNEGGDAAMRRLSGPQRALYALQQARVDDPRTPLETYPMPDGWRARVIAEEDRGL